MVSCRLSLTRYRFILAFRFRPLLMFPQPPRVEAHQEPGEDYSEVPNDDMNGKPTLDQWNVEQLQVWLRQANNGKWKDLPVHVNGGDIVRNWKSPPLLKLMLGDEWPEICEALRPFLPSPPLAARPVPSPGVRKFLNVQDRPHKPPKYETSTSAAHLSWQVDSFITEAYYHVPLKDLLLEDCVRFACVGGLHLIHGHYRSSKTTHLVATSRRLALLGSEYVALSIYFAFSISIRELDEEAFWACVSSNMRKSASWLSEFSTRQGFIKAIMEIRSAKVVLLCDEFQALNCNSQVQLAFLSAIRELRNQPSPDGSRPTLHAMLGFGTYNIRQLTKDAMEGRRTISPFNISEVVAIPQPAREACMKPFIKYAQDAASRQVQIDSEAIINDILSRARRHLGLLSLCGYTLWKLEIAGRKQISLADWLTQAVNLSTRVLALPEYSWPIARITADEALRLFTVDLLQREDPFQLTTSELEQHQDHIDALIDLGMLDPPTETKMFWWTAPILRDAVLEHVYPRKRIVSLPSAPPIYVNERWCVEALLEQALPLLDRGAICSHYVRNASSCPSEHILQAEFYSVLRELVSPITSYKVFPEAKDKKKLGRRRIDILLANCARVVFEIKVNAQSSQALEKAARQALRYGRALGAQQTVLLNFVPATASLPSKLASLFPHSGELMTFHVLFSDGFHNLTMLLAPAAGEQEPQRRDMRL